MVVTLARSNATSSDKVRLVPCTTLPSMQRLNPCATLNLRS